MIFISCPSVYYRKIITLDKERRGYLHKSLTVPGVDPVRGGFRNFFDWSSSHQPVAVWRETCICWLHIVCWLHNWLFSDADWGLCGCVMRAVLVPVSIYCCQTKNSWGRFCLTAWIRPCVLMCLVCRYSKHLPCRKYPVFLTSHISLRRHNLRVI